MWQLLLTVAAANTHDEDRARMIEKINSSPGVLWKAGMTERFGHLPVGASKNLCGVKAESAEDLRAGVAAGRYGRISKREGLEAPESFDAAEKWPECAKTITDIRDQSNCGCCWAFGAAEAISDRLCIATGGKVQVPLSAQETCFCAQSDGCDGGMLATGWEYTKKHGLATGGQYKGSGPFGAGMCNDFSLPHCHHHGPQGSDPYPDENKPGCPATTESPQCPKSCDADAKAPYDDFASYRYKFDGEVNQVDSDETAIMHEIMTNGPVEAAFSVYSDFENYVSGIYHATSSQMMGGHAIKITGWGAEDGVKYWKVQNSWNPHWGEKGYFRIKRGTDECGIEDQVVANTGSWTGPGVSEEVLV
jgi:cathepsin B